MKNVTQVRFCTCSTHTLVLRPQVWHYTRGLAFAASARAADGGGTPLRKALVADELAGLEVRLPASRGRMWSDRIICVTGSQASGRVHTEGSQSWSHISPRGPLQLRCRMRR